MTIAKGNPTRTRIWEIDALRGLLILCVLATHLYYTVDAFCIDGYYNIDSYSCVNASDPLHFWFDWGEDGVIYKAFLPDNIRLLWMRLGVDGFFVLSGISCIFSRNTLTRGLKMLAGAFIVSGFTKLLAVWTGNPSQFIRFGALHCYAYCHLIYYFFLENKKSRTLLLTVIPVFLLGYYLRYNPVSSNLSLLYPFGVHEVGAVGRDYWPILPMLGWLLVGVVLGRKYYADKQSLFPNSSMIEITHPFQWLGRKSGQIYLLHMFIYTAVFCGIGYLFGLL